MSLVAGDRLGPYEIIAPAGEGGMGEVYRARDTRLDRIVAVKVSKSEFTERFEREARAVAALNHPNICQLYDVGPNFLVMEFVEGVALEGPLSLGKAVEYSGQILDALDAAHRKGITHRDLKPANVLVTRQGIKLLDFGLAKQHAAVAASTDATVKASLTTRGEFVGTLQYMAPEQLQGKDADVRSDLFAFGCVLYEMLTGKRAFDGESAASVIAAILEREPAHRETTQPVDRVIQRCLAKDPDQRFQNALDLKTALLWATEQRPPVATAAPGKRRWWMAAGALIAAGILGAAGWWRFGAPASDDRVLRLQIPHEGGNVFPLSGFALSPDGRMVAYIASHNGRTVLWVRALDGSSARPVEGTQEARSPFWSPDSRSIGYSDTLRLWRVDLSGGAPRVICDSLVFDGLWLADGRIIFARIGEGLHQVAASGGEPSPVTFLDRKRGETAHNYPQILPDGRLVFRIRATEKEHWGMFATSFANPAERFRISPEPVARFVLDNLGRGYLMWRRGATLVAQEHDLATLKAKGEPQPIADHAGGSDFISQLISGESGLLLYTAADAGSNLYWASRDGKRLAPLGEPRVFTTFRLSPDAHRIAMTEGGASGTDVWLLEPGRGGATRLTFAGPNNIGYPVWSPDGRTVVFRNGDKLYRKNADGSGGEEPIGQAGGSQFPTDWSRDGRFLLFYDRVPETRRDLWVLPMGPDGKPAADAKPRLYLRTKFNEYFGVFAPEPSPRWILYQSDESGREEIYVQGFPKPSGKFQVSAKGGRYGRWGVRGEEIFFVSPDNKLMAAPVKLGAESVTVSPPVELFELPAGRSAPGHPYDVAADGRFLIPAPVDGSTQTLNLIVNWPALLKRQSR